MTEIEKIEYTKSFIDKLANGINPLDNMPVPGDDLLNNVRISRCMFYVSDILRQVIENGGVKQQKKTKKAPFEITPEQLEKFEYSDTPLSLSEIAARLKALIDPENMQSLSYNDFSDTIFDLAKQFASAETIVIAAPYWDSSFPSMLKIYLENIYVIGIVTDYDDKGMPKGLCSAKKLYYVTTAGGVYDSIYSYGYIENLAKNYFGIKQTELVKAEMLDIVGFDAEDILQREIQKWQ